MILMVRNFSAGDQGELKIQLAVKKGILFQAPNLSRHKFLRTLETTAQSLPSVVESKFLETPVFLKAVLSTTSAAPLDVVVIYKDIFLVEETPNPHCKRAPHCNHNSLSELAMTNRRFQQHLRAFREMHAVRGFRLVFCVDAVECMLEQSVHILETFVNEEKALRGFDYLLCEPLIVCENRLLRTRRSDFNAGWSGTIPNVSASAL